MLTRHIRKIPKMGLNYFSTSKTMEEIPVIDGKKYIEKGPGWEQECEKVMQSFKQFGIVKLQDTRVNHQDNSNYIDMVERYFETISQPFYETGTHEDIKPHFHY